MQGSWIEALQNRFKNMRRGSNATGKNEDSDSNRMGKKRIKLDARLDKLTALTSDVHSDYDQVNYDRDVKLLATECSKKKRNVATIRQLMVQTYSRRRHWIIEDLPPLRNILKEFPAFHMSKMVGIIGNICRGFIISFFFSAQTRVLCSS